VKQSPFNVVKSLKENRSQIKQAIRILFFFNASFDRDCGIVLLRA